MTGTAARLLPVAVVIAALAPLYVALVGSLTPDARLFQSVPLVPTPLVWDHYRALFGTRGFWVPLGNSLVVAVATTLLALLLGAPCAYALARLRFRGRAIVLALVLAVSMLPQISVVPPLFLFLRELGLIDTHAGLVLPYLTFAMPLTIWFLVTVFRQVPLEIEEAAMMDGASRLVAFRRIVLPLAAPGLATTALLTFLFSWNEFLFALTFTLGPERHTVPVAIALFRGQYQVPWGEVLAAALVATLPVALVVLVAQRRLVSGLTAGGVKG
ncbi:MAG: carbohydrate ABC transporter permease [Acidobacteria bacterium]|nr:carbohydrate ABC transporter permease [Acidobacteriota bacterium]